jgi:hypothetical protein
MSTSETTKKPAPKGATGTAEAKPKPGAPSPETARTLRQFGEDLEGFRAELEAMKRDAVTPGSLTGQVENLAKAVSKLQELLAEANERAADAIVWAPCPCGGNFRETSNLRNPGIRKGMLWHDLGHFNVYGDRV